MRYSTASLSAARRMHAGLASCRLLFATAANVAQPRASAAPWPAYPSKSHACWREQGDAGDYAAEGMASLWLCRKLAWKRHRKVALQHGFEGAWGASCDGMDGAWCAWASPRGGQGPLSSLRVLHS